MGCHASQLSHTYKGSLGSKRLGAQGNKASSRVLGYEARRASVETSSTGEGDTDASQGAFTDLQVDCLRSTWPVLAASRIRRGASIFLEIFSIEPRIKQLFTFRDVDDSSLNDDARFIRHVIRYMNVLEMGVESLEVLHTPASLANRHLVLLGAAHAQKISNHVAHAQQASTCSAHAHSTSGVLCTEGSTQCKDDLSVGAVVSVECSPTRNTYNATYSGARRTASIDVSISATASNSPTKQTHSPGHTVCSEHETDIDSNSYRGLNWRRHCELFIQCNHFIWEQVLGEEYTVEVRQAWHVLFTLIAEALETGYMLYMSEEARFQAEESGIGDSAGQKLGKATDGTPLDCGALSAPLECTKHNRTSPQKHFAKSSEKDPKQQVSSQPCGGLMAAAYDDNERLLGGSAASGLTEGTVLDSEH